MRRIFSNEVVNTGRQVELDLMKALTIFLMIWTHVYEEYVDPSALTAISEINALVRGGLFGAVTFMFAMGIGMAYTRHNTAQDLLERGLKLLRTALLLMVVRDVIPGFTCYMLTGFQGFPLLAMLIIGVDILQFAAVAFLFMALLQKLKLSDTQILLVSILMSVAGTMLEGVSCGNYVIDQLLGWFIGTPTESYFCLFNWFIFVAFGRWFGYWYKRVEDKKTYHLIMSSVGVVVCTAYIYLSRCVDNPVFLALNDERYLAHRPFVEAVIACIGNAGIVSLFYYLAKIIPSKWIPALCHPSKNINVYYCFSWVAIVWSYAILSLCDRWLPETDLEVILVWLVIFAISIPAVIIYTKWLRAPVCGFFGRHNVFWTVVLGVIVLAVFLFAYTQHAPQYPNFLNGYLGLF